jgi:hypothetical protein
MGIYAPGGRPTSQLPVAGLMDEWSEKCSFLTIAVPNAWCFGVNSLGVH